MLVIPTQKEFKATLPAKKHVTDVGYDLTAMEEVTLYAGETIKIHTGIRVAIPDHLWGWITTRSSYAAKGVVVIGGIIDPGYRGELTVVLCNTRAPGSYLSIAPGDRVAQLIILPRIEATFLEVENLDTSSRGEGGFGSTGG